MAGVSRLERHERRTSTPLAVGAGLFLVVYAIPVVWPGAGGAVTAACRAANVALWVAFAADLAVRAALSGHPPRYLRHHVLDMVVSTVLVAAVAELEAERGAPGANITSFADSL